MVYQDWSFDMDNFHDKMLHDPIQFGDNNNVNGLEVKGGFFRTRYLLDWVAMLALLRSSPEPPPRDNIFSSLSLFHASIHFIHTFRIMMR